jgi:hypothetical protein
LELPEKFSSSTSSAGVRQWSISCTDRSQMKFALLSILILWAETSGAESGTPDRGALSFRNDVMPVLARAGCNLGACHGAQTGKGRLALSLRGEDPAKDHATLLKSFVSTDAPEKSLLLRKATLAIPHEGGLRFDTNSESARILTRWIASGAPPPKSGEPTITRLEATPAERVAFAPEKQVAIEVTARFSDGSKRNVNRWAIFEPSSLDVEIDPTGLVTSLQPGETTVNIRHLGLQATVQLAFVPERPGFIWNAPPAANFVDEALQNKWRKLRLLPSELCNDATFVRRAFLDLTGAIPTAGEAEAFVKDAASDKRAQLIDQLLKRPEFADFWTLKWGDLLRLEEKVLDRRGVAAFHGWIRQSIAENKPIDRFCREILSALGSTYQVPPANYYRALREPDQRAEAVAQIFLGTRLSCAKCHNHPFERWTMDDYYGFAAVFDGMDYEIKENKRFDKNDKNNFVGEQVVKLVDKRKLKHPRTGKLSDPRLLGMDATIDNNAKRLDALASWLTSPEHPLFARVQINRIWFHLMGRGLVDPIDDFRATNPAVNPALLDALAKDFVKSGFDLRHAIRTICASRAYQLASLPNETNAEDEINFSRVIPRRLGAEQLLDSVHLALGGLPEFEGYDQPMRAVSLPGIRAIYRPKRPTRGDTFLHLFGKPPRLTNSDTERANDTSLAQIFELTSGGTLNTLLRNSNGTLARLVKDAASDPELVSGLYWTILSRAPDTAEKDATAAYLGDAKDRRAAAEDLAWALLNAKEFLLRK